MFLLNIMNKQDLVIAFCDSSIVLEAANTVLSNQNEDTNIIFI